MVIVHVCVCACAHALCLPLVHTDTSFTTVQEEHSVIYLHLQCINILHNIAHKWDIYCSWNIVGEKMQQQKKTIDLHTHFLIY